MLLICALDTAEERGQRGGNALFAQNKDVKVVSFLQGQQLMDLEHKLTVAKEELEKTALDKVDNSRGNECFFLFNSAVMGSNLTILSVAI